MNKEILTIVEMVSNEKGVEKELLFEAIEAALASATEKRSRENIQVRVSIDRDSGDYETFRRWKVLADDIEPEFPEHEINLVQAQQREPEAAIDGYIEEHMASMEFGRIAAQAARQVIFQKVRDAEHAQMVALYQDRIGEMVSGIVKKVERNGVTLDLGNNSEAFIPRDQLIPKESLRLGDRRRAYLQEIREDTKSVRIILSRTKTELLIELFKIEVPEVNEGIISIVSGARDPGVRAKIAVKANDPRIDPIGACVGMRGSRVQAISTELSGERVDIILWNQDPAQFLISAMAPAEVDSIMVDEEKKIIDIAVAEDNLSQAIGRGGQNVRLASELTGWKLNVLSVVQAAEKIEVESESLRRLFMERLDVDEEVAIILVQEGFSSIEEIAYVPEGELVSIEEFDESLVNELRGRARDLILTRSIASEQKIADLKPSQDLLEIEGMDEMLAYELVGNGVSSMEELAEQSIDDLLAISNMDEERAGKLIMAARQPWFNEEVNNDSGKVDNG